MIGRSPLSKHDNDRVNLQCNSL